MSTSAVCCRCSKYVVKFPTYSPVGATLFPLPRRLVGLGERRELPQLPRPLSHFLHILGHRTLLVAARKIRFSCKKYKFHFEKVVLTVTTTSKSGGDKSPSSHTKLRLWICSLGHGLHTFTAVPVLTQPSTLSGTIKWVSAFRLSNSNKRRWWMWMAAAYWRTHKPSRLAWSEGWQPPSAECAFIKWTRCTLAMALATMTVR